MGSASSGLTPCTNSYSVSSQGRKLFVDVRLCRVVSHFWQGALDKEGIVLRDFVISDSQLTRKRAPFCFQTFNLQMHFLFCGPPI